MFVNVLVEDDNAINEHGLSLYIEYDNQKILFDTGQSDLYLINAKKLGVDLTTIDLVILSHGHYDHGNGLKYLKSGTLLSHPEVFSRRYRNNGMSIGLNITKEEANKDFNLITSKKPYFIAANICFLGEIKARKTKYVLEDGSVDYIPDDSAVAISTKKGIIIITGCSHAGIVNVINKSMEVFNDDRIYAVIGGFHLKAINSSLDRIINKMKTIEHIYTGHCTSKKVINYMNRKGLAVKKLKSLMIIEV